MIAFLRCNLFDFEQAAARRNALILLLAAAIISPDIDTIGPLPAVRLEQLALLALLPSFAVFYRAHPELRRPMVIDWAFAAFALAITASLLFAPLIVDQSHYSLRDPFEVARVVEYWLMFRLAFTVVPTALTMTWVGGLIAVAAIASGLFGVLQYVGPPGFNSTITDLWADSHNYEGVVRRSRVVGAVGNANYFGILSGLFLLVCLGLVLLRVPLSGWRRWLVYAAILFSTAGVVMSQSRTAAFAVLGAMALGLVFTFVRIRGRAAYGTAVGLFAGALVLSVAFVEAVPPKFGTFHDRFSLSALTDDPSVTIRISKWKSLFAGFFEDTPERCVDTRLDARQKAGHETPSNSRPTAVAPDVAARDATRKQDISAIADAVQKYSCDTNRWPTGDLAKALVPKYLPAVPNDPGGRPYATYLAPNGFMVGATLENEDDPEGPIYALGTMPNMIVNPSFESSASIGDKWKTAGSVDGRPTTLLSEADSHLYGKQAINAVIGPSGSLYQLTVFDFPLKKEFTASVRVRSASGAEQRVSLYLIGVLSDGTTLDPMTHAEHVLPADGRWVPLTVTFTTPSPGRLSVLEFSVRNPTGAGDVDVDIDGAMVNEGGLAASFPYVEDVDPARLRPVDLPGFADSPLIGIGPQKDREVGAFDNEYALMLDRYGGLGTVAYLFWMVAGFVLALRAAQLAWQSEGRNRLGLAALGLGLATYTLAQAAFNIAAGSFYSFQLMAIYWLLIGFVGRGVHDRRAALVPEAEPAAPVAMLSPGGLQRSLESKGAGEMT